MMLKVYWGEARVWMDLAKELYMRNVDDELDKLGGYPHSNEMSVAYVCAGYAFELIYKVLAEAATGRQAKATHRPSDSHKELPEEDRIEVEQEIDRHEWGVDQFLEYLDNSLCHKDRKYWWRTKKGGPLRGAAGYIGRYRCDRLHELHAGLARLAVKWINATATVHEIWPGTPEPA